MSDGDGDRKAVEEAEIIYPPLEKKQKLNDKVEIMFSPLEKEQKWNDTVKETEYQPEIMFSPPEKEQKLNDTVKETEYQPKINDDSEAEEVEYVEFGEEEEEEDDEAWCIGREPISKERIEELIRKEKELDEKLRIDWSTYEPIDLTHAILISVNPQEDVSLQVFENDSFPCFYRLCHNRRTLQLYDHPGDPRPGGLMHWEIESGDEEDDNLASFAIDQYNDLIDKTTSSSSDGPGKLEFKGLDKVTCTPFWDSFKYITFKALDKLQGKVKTYQAQLLESSENDLLLGMLRDADEKKVLAVLKLKEGPEEDTLISVGSTST